MLTHYLVTVMPLWRRTIPLNTKFMQPLNVGDHWITVANMLSTGSNEVQLYDSSYQTEMAKVAAVLCVHNCIQTVCGGNEKTGKGCRFDLPKKSLNHTVPAVMQVNATWMEGRTLLRRTCSRVPNLNEYCVMDLPVVRWTYANVDVVGFYRRLYLTLSVVDKQTTVFSDHTEYSAYAEHCCDKTVIVNRKNAPGENILTKDMVAGMNFCEFAELVSHKWHKDSGIGTEQTDEPTGRRIMTRDIYSGHWVLKQRAKHTYIRFIGLILSDLLDSSYLLW